MRLTGKLSIIGSSMPHQPPLVRFEIPGRSRSFTCSVRWESSGSTRIRFRPIDRVRRGIHTVAATPTASGKTLIYTLPIIEAVLNDSSAGALFIYPLKALAQDQLKNHQHDVRGTVPHQVAGRDL